MPRLPDATALGEAPTPQPSMGVAQVQAADQSALGRGMAAAGGELQEAAGIIATTNARQDELVARAAANKLAEEALAAEFDPEKGFRNVKGEGAVGQPFVQDYSKRFTDARDAIRNGLTTEFQRRAFDQLASVQGLQFQGSLLKHQAAETDAFNDKTDDATIKLSLRKMATDPTNELAFQTERVAIDGTIDSAMKRKGLGEKAATELKAQFFDAAYTARITAIMDGIPGVVNASPYLAEKMFRQVQGQLGPQAQLTLADKVLKSVKNLQARDTAQSLIFGTQPTDPKIIAPATQGTPPLAGVQATPVKPADVQAKDLPPDNLSAPGLESAVTMLESGGRRFDASGNLIQGPVTRSGARAQGEMQVMPATAANPGFGVRPAVPGPDGKISPEEYARVGRDYLGAMTARYDNPVLVMAAYNAGPGAVDKWLASIGDPRTGAISATEWAAKIPYAETRNYVLKGMSLLANAEVSGYGNRADGTPKGPGFLGELKRPDGGVSTEISIGVNIDGKEVEIPTLVPTLTKAEINHLLNDGEPTEAIVQKAVAHARARIAQGKSPFAEAAPATQKDALPVAPTAAQLITFKDDYIRRARDIAERQYPGDTAYADSVVARVETYANQVIQAQQAREHAATETLLGGAIGSRPDGSDKPQNIDQLLANPQMKVAWDSATPQTRAAIQERMAKGDNKLTKDGFDRYDYLLGLASENRAAFLREDLGKYFGTMPDSLLLELSRLKRSMGTADAKQAEKAASLSKAKGQVADILKASGIDPNAKVGTNAANALMKFYGRFEKDLEAWQTTNGKPPTESEVRKIAAGLLVQGKAAGDWLFGSRVYEVEDLAGFTVPVPVRGRADIYRKFEEDQGKKAANLQEVERWYTQQKVQGKL